MFLDKLMDDLLGGKEISITTFRAGYRDEFYQLCFAERELLVEFGYPTQWFVLLPKHKEDIQNDTNKE